MNPEVFTSVLDIARKEGFEHIYLGANGEPFMHKNICDFISQCNGMEVIFPTKLFPRFDKDKFEDAVSKTRKTTLVISIDAWDKETHEYISPGINFEKRMNDLQELASIKHPALNVEFCTIVIHQNENKLTEIREGLEGLGFTNWKVKTLVFRSLKGARGR
jgi:wyosine [tRNA(Phe)-imidazoG37] synthetase (radical SAM superfamily)